MDIPASASVAMAAKALQMTQLGNQVIQQTMQKQAEQVQIAQGTPPPPDLAGQGGRAVDVFA
jgi:hypothetical protein